MSNPSGYLAIAFVAMERKARSPKNLAKPSWVGMSDAELDERIWEEMQELKAALALGNSAMILDEACDVMAFAAMRADTKRTNHGPALTPVGRMLRGMPP